MRGLPVAKRKVLYLLHGLSDDGSAWQRYTSIETIAALYGLVVVMPSVGRSFYTDQPNGQKYFSYLTDELPHYLKDVFGLSPHREDTLIAGNSMGGYGAFKAAFLHPELYSAAASFSGVLSLAFVTAYPNDPRRPEFEILFGDLEKLAGSEHDPAEWLRRYAENPGACQNCMPPAAGRMTCTRSTPNSMLPANPWASRWITTRKMDSMIGSSGMCRSNASWQPI